MKKHSKILSLVLSVILLLGVFVISSSAALIADDGNPLTPVYEEGTNVRNYKVYTFDSADDKVSGSNSANTLDAYKDAKNFHGTATKNGNKFYEMRWIGGKGYVDLPLQDTSSKYNKDDVGDMHYYTYMVASVDVTSYGNYLTEDYTKADYLSNNFYLYTRGESGSKTLSAYFVEGEDGWYIATSKSLSSSSTKKIKINGGVGEWNNITFVLVSNGASTKGYMYINGQYLTEGAMATAPEYCATSIRFNEAGNTTTKPTGESVALDNFTVTYYGASPIGTDGAYKTSDAVQGLDDFFDGVTAKTQHPIYYLEDIAYNAKYANAIPYELHDENGNFLFKGALRLDEELKAPEGLGVVKTDLKNGTYSELVGWESDQMTSSMLTPGEFKALYDSGSKIIATPVFGDEVKVTGYMITEKDKFGAERLVYASNDVSTLRAKYEELANDELTVTLYDDLYIDVSSTSSRIFIISAGRTLNFDLNGHKLIQSGFKKSYFSAGIFYINEGVELNLYSSNAGGAVYQSIYSTDKGYLGSQGLIEFATLNGCTINLGDRYVDGKLVASGNNLSAFCGTLINPATDSAADYKNDDVTIDINVNGGYYYGMFYPSYGLINVRDADMKVKINNAMMYTEQSSGFFYSVELASADIEIKNSTLVSTTCFLNNWRDHDSISFEGCTIVTVGVFNYSTKQADSTPDVIFKGGNKISSNIDLSDAKKYSIADGVILANANNGAFTETLSVSHTKIQYDYVMDGSTKTGGSLNKEALKEIETISGTFEYSFLTLNSLTDNANVKAVVWQDANGGAFQTEYWYAGSDVSGRSPTSNEIGANPDKFPVVKLDNNWYNLAYGGEWKLANSTREDMNIVKADDSNVFAPMQAPIAAPKMLVNANLYANFQIFVYIPLYKDNGSTSTRAEGVTYNGVYKEAALTNKVSVGTRTFEDGTRYNVSSYVNASNPTVALNYYLSFTVNHEGKTYDLVYNIKVDLAQYAAAVLKHADYGCKTEEATLMVTLVNYLNEMYKVNNKNATYDAFDEILAAHASCGCLTDQSYNAVKDTFSDDEKAVTADSYANLKNHFGAAGATFLFGANVTQPSLNIYVHKDYAPAKVGFEYYGVRSGKLELISASATKSDSLVDPDGDGPLAKEYYSYRLAAVSATNTCAPVTIYFYGDDNKVLEKEVDGEFIKAIGVYSLSAYINNNQTVDAARALYTFAQAAFDYKVTYEKELNK